MSPLSTPLADPPWIVWVVLVPLAAAVVAIVRPQRAVWPAGAAAIGVAAATAGLTWQVWELGPQRYALGGWGAPLGIDLYADGASVLMLLMTAATGACVTVYAIGYFPGRTTWFWPLWLLLWGALDALFLSADVFNLYVTLELITLSAVGLVALGGRVAAAAALQYLLAALLGSSLYLAGVALLYGAYGTLDLASLGRAVAPDLAATAAAAFMIAGLAVKTALFPVHFWLPPAHADAPAPVSAVLSALVVKASFYVVLRLWFEVFPAVMSPGSGLLLAVLGSAAIFWGSLQAFLAPRLKMLVAYSTVAQLGYLFLVFALAGGGEPAAAWAGGLLFAASHGLAKASLFLAAGAVQRAAGHDRLAELEGIGRRMPVTFFSMGMAGVALMGLPPTGAFTAKWILVEAAIANGQGGLAFVIVAGGVLAAAYLFRLLALAFRPFAAERALRVPGRMEWPALVLAVVALLLGLLTAPLLELLEIGGPEAARLAQKVTA